MVYIRSLAAIKFTDRCFSGESDDILNSSLISRKSNFVEFWNQRKKEEQALRLLGTRDSASSGKTADDMHIGRHRVSSLGMRTSSSQPNLASISEVHEEESILSTSNPLASSLTQSDVPARSVQFSVASDASVLDSFRNANLQRASTMNFLGQLNLITSIDTKAQSSEHRTTILVFNFVICYVSL